MGMVPEAAVAMSRARIGAVHSVVFGLGGAPRPRAGRGAELVITQDVGLRGSRESRLGVDAALEGEHGVRHVVVFKRTDEPVGWDADRDVGGTTP